MLSIFDQDKPLPYDLSNLSIMVVEDSPYMQSLMASMLKVFGVGDIMVCEDAREAEELLTVTLARASSRYTTNCDIVLTDWLMPRGSGQRLLKWIREHNKPFIHFLPVIVVSGYTTEKITSTTRDMGANEILVKPVSANALAGRICSVIDNPRPFVRSPDYFGPDRRRQDMIPAGEERRKTRPEELIVKREKGVSLL